MLRKPLALVCLFACVLVGSVFAGPEPGSKRKVVLEGSISKTLTLKAKRTYLLRGGVYVRKGAKLRVPAGTEIQCEPGAFLSVEPGAAIEAVGSHEAPIVFTSAKPPAERARGDWGGLIISGYAPVSAPGSGPSVKNGEAGADVSDSSGTLRFVRIEYAGTAVGDGFMTALAFRGVGYGTAVDYVETLNSAGGGVSIVGGTVNLKHIVSVGNAGDGFNWSSGWTGRAQFLVTQQRGDIALSERAGLEADTNNPHIENATFVGGGSGIRLQNGARGDYRNILVVGCQGEGLDLDDQATLYELQSGQLTLDKLLLFGRFGGTNVSRVVRDQLAQQGALLVERDPLLVNPFDEAVPDFRPVSGSPALVGDAQPDDDPFFEPVSFIGAFGAGDDDDWTAGWTNFETPPNPRYLANASPNPEALAAGFLDALAAGDVPALKRFRITKNEFCYYLWRELPASTLPNVTCDFAWSQATLNSLAGLNELLGYYNGRRFELVSVRFAGGSESYPSYTVHYDTRLTVRDESGNISEVKLFGSMLEMNGQYKLFSHVID